MLSSKRNILYFRCSDGRCQRPEDLRDHCVHQIRVPGGILFPELCAKHLGVLLGPLVKGILMFAIDIMIKLKKPDEIDLASHEDCGAANDLDFDLEQVKRKHETLAKKLRKHFPEIRVRVQHEKLPNDENDRSVHEVVALFEEPVRQMAAQES